jgi:AcrR family transcriptional regulator
MRTTPPTPNFAKSVRALLRERLLDAAGEIATAEGWSGVTMVRVAAAVGVSRQTVYKELGSKPALAEALILRETDLYLTGITGILETEDDPVAAIADATRYTLASAAENPLLKVVLSGSGGEHDDLLPLLTTGSAPVLERGLEVLVPLLHRRHPGTGLSTDEWRTVVELMVRMVLSHVVQPTEPVDRVVRRLRWVVSRVLRAPADAE